MAIGANIVVTFSEAVQRGTGNIVLKTAAGVTVATYDAATSTNLSISSNTLTINPSSDLGYSTAYKVEFAAGSIKDSASNQYAGTTSYNFTTTTASVAFSDALWANTGSAPANITWGSDLYYTTTTFNQVSTVMKGISDVANVSYSFVGLSASTYIYLNAGNRSWANYPTASDVWLSTNHYLSKTDVGARNEGEVGTYTGSWFRDHSSGTFQYADLLHELGHTLGLKHVHNGEDSSSPTTELANLRGPMTYFLGDGTNTYNTANLYKAWVTIMAYDYGGNPDALTPMILDVIVLSQKYGLPSRNMGNDFHSPANGDFVNGRYQTVVDAGGQDCIDLSSLSEAMHIDLGRDVGAIWKLGVVTTMTGWTNMHLGSDPLSLTWLYGDFEDAIGGSGNDELVGSHLGNALKGGGGMDHLDGGRGADSLTGGAESDTFVFSALDSGQAIGFDVIMDYSKGQRGTGDVIDYTVALTPGGSTLPATSSEAFIKSDTGVATFASNSGTTIADALADVAARLTAAGDSTGEFAFFQVNRQGDYYIFISDGTAGISSNDVVIQLVGVTSISQIDLNQGNLTIIL